MVYNVVWNIVEGMCVKKVEKSLCCYEFCTVLGSLLQLDFNQLMSL